MRFAGRFCRSASIDLDAEDAVQEALIAFWELAEQGYPMSNPKALLVKITKNICISRYRKRRLETEPIASDNFLGGTSASSLVEMADERIIKQRLYDTLTKTERLYMQMRSEQGLSLDEMMQETGGSRASVKMALSKAKKKLLFLCCRSLFAYFAAMPSTGFQRPAKWLKQGRIFQQAYLSDYFPKPPVGNFQN